MKTIWKERLNPLTKTEMFLPKGAKVLSSMFKDGHASIFIEVNPDAEQVKRSFKTIGTGWQVPEGRWQFVGTVMDTGDDDYGMVFHIYELPEK